MTKVRSPLSIHGVIDCAFEELGGKDEVLTILPHRKRASLYDMTNPDRDEEKAVRIPYDDVRALTRAGARAFAEDLARLSGMQLVPMGGADPVTALALQRKGAILMTEVGEVVTTLAASLEDGQIDAREAEAIAAQALDVKRAASLLLDAIASLTPNRAA